MALPELVSPARQYRQHRPQETLLYRLVADHLETFLGHAREHHDHGLPTYVENELRSYLRCGIHAHGFLRARCKACGKALLVAFSCKKRGVCPSCNARRMCGTAAHLVDHVLPEVPLRQWVLSVPYELRLLLARDPRTLSATGRIFVEEIFRWQRERARLHGLRGVRGGALSFPQRFGGSLNLNVHFHVAVPDGVFVLTKGAERADFHCLAKPNKTELDTLAFNVEMRVTAWLRRRGLLADNDSDAGGATTDRSALDACLEGSLGLGELSTLPATPSRRATRDADAPPPKSKSGQYGGQSRGFDVHAGVVVSGSDRDGRERLLRYCARPPLSLERLSVLHDGRVAYAIRKPWGKETHRVMDPVQFLARLAALVPPPRQPLLRFHGVLAPHSSWRKKVVPLKVGCNASGAEQCKSAVPTREASVWRPDEGKRSRPGVVTGICECSGSIGRGLTATCTAVASPLHCAPFALRAPSTRIDWSELLKRIYDVDALACSCGGRLQFIALILEEAAAQAILESLGLPSRAPPVARARSPDWADPIPEGDE